MRLRAFGVLDEMQRRVAQLGDIVRRDRGRHADRDALRAVGEQIGKRRRQHRRLLQHAVVIGAEIHGVFVDAVEQEPRGFGQPRFGVAVGRGVIAVDIAEIALAVDQRIARGKILREPHQRVIDRLVAMRVEIAHDVADDLRRFLERRAGIEAQQPHAVKDAAMHGFEPIARVGQRAVHDGRQRIGEIALLKRFAQRNFLHVARIRGNQLSCSWRRAVVRLAAADKNSGDETPARVGHRKAARRKSVTLEEEAGQRKGIGEIGGGRWLRPRCSEKPGSRISLSW